MLVDITKELERARGGGDLKEELDKIIPLADAIEAASLGRPSIAKVLVEIQEGVHLSEINLKKLETSVLRFKEEISEHVKDPVIKISDRSVNVTFKDQDLYNRQFFPIDVGGVIAAEVGEGSSVKILVKDETEISGNSDNKFMSVPSLVYDAELLREKSGKLESKAIGAKRIPLPRAIIVGSDAIDVCSIDNFLIIKSNYTNEDSRRNGDNKSHLVNLLQGYEPYVISEPSITLFGSFITPVLVNSIRTVANCNSNSSEVSIRYKLTDGSWVDVLPSPVTTATFQVGVWITDFEVHMRIYELEVKNPLIEWHHLEIMAQTFSETTGVITSNDLLLTSDVSQDTVSKDDLIISPTGDFKIAITNGIKDKFYSYIPNKLNIDAPLFTNKFNKKGMANKITAMLFATREAVYRVSIRFKKDMDSVALVGELGANDAVGYAGRKQPIPSSISLNPDITFNLFISINGVEHIVPLVPECYNNLVEIGDTDVFFKATGVTVDTMRILIDSKIVRVIDYVKIKGTSAYNFFKPTDISNYSSQSNSSTLVSTTRESLSYDFKSHITTWSGQYYINVSYMSRDKYGDWRYYNTVVANKQHAPLYTMVLPSVYEDIKHISKDLNFTGDVRSNESVTPDCRLPVSVFISKKATMDVDVYDSLEYVYGKTVEYRDSKSDYYDGRTFKSDASILGIYAFGKNFDNVGFAISTDGYTFRQMVLQDDGDLQWVPFDGVGMSKDIMESLTTTDFEHLKEYDNVYVRVIFNDRFGEIDNIEIVLDGGRFIEIEKEEILSKGISARDLQELDLKQWSDEMRQDLIQVYSVSETHNEFIPLEVKDIPMKTSSASRWDSNYLKYIEAKYGANENTMLIKNIHNRAIQIKVLSFIHKHKRAVINLDDGIVEDVDLVKDKYDSLVVENKNIKQNIQVIHEAMLEGNVPVELPNELLPTTQVIEIEKLPPGEVFTSEPLESVRGIQIWEGHTERIPSARRVYYDKKHEIDYKTHGLDFLRDAVTIAKEPDVANIYLQPRPNPVKVITNQLEYDYGAYSVKFSKLADTRGQLNSTLMGPDRGGYENVPDAPAHASYWQSTHQNVSYYLTGEQDNHADIVMDLKQKTYIDRFRVWANYAGDGGRSCSVSISDNGIEYTEIWNGMNHVIDLTINVKSRCRYIRIRLHIPYNYNRSMGWVAIRRFEVYQTPDNYAFNKEFIIYNKVPIDTSKFGSLMGFDMDKEFEMDKHDVRFYLCDDGNMENYKTYKTNVWRSYNTITYANGMTPKDFLELTEEVLKGIQLGQLTIIGVFKTIDRFRTPILRNIDIKYNDGKVSPYMKLIDTSEVEIYNTEENRIAIKNITNADKKYKVVIL